MMSSVLGARKRLATHMLAFAILVFGLFGLVQHQETIAHWVDARVRKSVQAALTIVTLNNGNGNVVSGFDISSQSPDLSPDSGGYRWSINTSTDFSVLNLAFNAGSSQTDFSGASRTGSLQNGAVYTASGRAGGGISFDGINDYINFASVPAFFPMTLSVWINPSDNSDRVLIDDNGAFTSMRVSLNSTGNVVYSQFDNTSSLCVSVTSVSTAPAATWSHVVIRRQSNGQIALYLNGVQQATNTISNNPAGNNPADFKIGQGAIGQDCMTIVPENFQGVMDEVQIYNRILSDAQITQLYNDGNAGLAGPTVIQAEETTLNQFWGLTITPITSAGSVGSAIASSNRVFIVSGTPTITGALDNPDEGSPIISALTIPGGSTAGYRWIVNGVSFSSLTIPLNSGVTQVDVSGNALNGTALNAPTFTTSGCVVGNCLTFNGTTQAVSVPDASAIDFQNASNFTAAVWFKTTSTASMALLSKHVSGSTNGFIIMMNQGVGYCTGAGRVNFYTSTTGGNDACGAAAYNDGNWHFAVGVYNGGLNTATLYIDGVAQTDIGVRTGSLDSTAGIGIGAIMNTGTPGAYFSGSLDQVQVFGRALSAAQVRQLYLDGASGFGGPTRIVQQEHSLGESWDLIATEFLSDGSVGTTGYIDSTTISAAYPTTLGITTPGTTQEGNVTISYTCSDSASVLRDFLVEYSTNGGSSYANATLVSTTSGSIVGSVLSMVACNSGTSSNSFVWNSLSNGVAPGILDSDVRIRITAQYPSGPSAETNNFSVQNAVVNTFTSPATIGTANTDYENEHVVCSGTTLTVDGTHTFASLTLQNNCTLTQTATSTVALNRTILTVTGATDIQSGSTINLVGRGYPNGYTAGVAGAPTTTGGATGNSGGSHGGQGYPVSGSAGVTYDSVYAPLYPGAGAANASAGGGYLQLTTGSMNLVGTITTNAAVGGGGANTGAGGGVWLTVNGSFTGSGTITANGGTGVVNNSHGFGGGGRIAVYYSSAISGNPSITSLSSRLQAYGGSTGGGTQYGAAGTVYIEDTSLHTTNNGELIVNNNSIPAVVYTIVSGSFGGLSIKNNALVRTDTLSIARDLVLTSTAVLTHDFTTTTTVYRLDITVGGETSIDATSSINVDSRGFPLGYTTNGAGGVTAQTGVSGNCGGSHGGQGGCTATTSVHTPPYDSVFEPADPGAGAHLTSSGTAGGGYVKLTTNHLTLAGVISANSTSSAASTGAGGGIWIITTGNINITGTIRANGGGSVNSFHGAGSGGRVAFKYNASLGSNPTTPTLSTRLQAFGGVPAGVTTTNRGAAGTVYIENTAVHAANDGVVYVDNNTSANTLQFTEMSGTVGDLYVENAASLLLTTLVINRDLSLTGSSYVTHSEATTSSVFRIDLTVGGTTTIESGSIINLDGKGFPLGYTSNGSGGVTAQTGVSGNCGGSHGGQGGCAATTYVHTPPYDSIFAPADPGAGAHLTSTGTAGGGYIKLTTSDLIMAGTISANALGSAASTGAGGGIWIIATGDVNVTGIIRANGGSSVNTSHGAGSGGRVAFRYDATTGSNPTVTALSAQLQAFGGVPGTANTTNRGSAGTVYIENTAVHTANDGVVYVDNNTSSNTLKFTELSGTLGDLFIENAASVLVTTLSVTRDLTMTGSSLLTHDTTTTGTVYRVDVTVGDETNIASGSSINVDSKGFPLGYTTNGAGGVTAQTGVSGNCGGSNGGRGGCASGAGVKTPAYGNFKQPVDPGAGAFVSSTGSAGGGYVKWTTGGFVMAGTITANGGSEAASNGAGGGIWITATGLTQVTGTIRANGGGSCNSSHGCGAGGRIAMYFNSSISGSTSRTAIRSQLQAFGGVPSAANATNRGGAGTIYIEDSSIHTAGQGDLRVNNNNSTTPTGSRTPLFMSGLGTTYTLHDLQVINLANLEIDTPCLGTPALTVNGVTDQSGGGIITNNQSGTCTVTQGVINITTTTLPGALINTAYSRTVESGGGYGPHVFVCRNGGVTVACTTVLPAGLDMSSAGVISGTPTLAGTSVFTVRATESAPGVGFDEQVLSLTIGNAPIQPTNLFSNSMDAQSCCSSAQMVDGSPVFSAVFNDVDAGDTASEYRIQVDDSSDLSSPLWDSGVNGTSVVGTCNNLSRCANISYAGPALSLSGATYYWRIKYWDALGFEGSFSSIADFTTDITPTAPTNLFVNDSNAQSGLTNPIGILAANPVFSAIYNDPDVGDTATKYRIQVDNNNNFSSPVWDSGSGGTNMTTCNEGSRCDDIVFGGADLERDETLYYWRIKFWDAAGVESPWSQDPTSTNTFKMGTGGGSVQVIQQQQLAPQPTVPEAPLAGATEVVDAQTVRWNWIDVSNNETGFRVLNAEGQVIAVVAAGQTSATESFLTANTFISGRSVVAYNDIGQSEAVVLPGIFTPATVAQPIVRTRGGDNVTFIIEPAFTVQTGQTTAFPGQTAVRFDLIVTNSEGETRSISSDWVQSNEYTFTGIAPEETVQVRVVTRNQQGLQNEPSTYAELGTLSRRFVVNMGVFKKGTETLPRPMSATDIISVRMQMTSVGTDTAHSVILNLPLPRYINYVPGTLIVDGRNSTDSADQEGSVANQNGVSASWATINPGVSHSVAFELAFDIEDLRSLRAATVVGTPDEVVAALVQAAANPLIHLQASVSFADSDAVYMSPVITLEPDVETAVEPVIEEIPVDETPIEDQPVQIPTPEETAIIEQILQQEFPSPSPTPQPGEPSPEPTPAPTLFTGETTSNSDAGSFNLNVTGEDSKLGLTGSASVNNDLITFSGTTTEPFTVITLIFNNSITAIAVSDANGFWQTFVDADRLGILPGQEATVKIEAIAAKGDLRSERVSVGDVVVSRGRSGDIAAEFDTTVSDSPIISVLEEIEHQVVKVVEEQEPVIKTTLTVSAPVVIVSSAPLWGYLPYAPTLIYHFISWMLGLVGRKRKDSDVATYGVVYDAITKLPLALAIVRVYNQADNKLASTIVTDKLGRYDALLAPGQYRLEVSKPQYQYPSGIVTSAVDGTFDRIYNKQTGFTVTEKGTVLPHVPVDPVNAQRQWQLSFGFKKLWLAFQRAGNLLATPIILVGLFMSLALLYAVPDKPSNWIIAGLYALTLAIQFKLKPKLIKAWGVVYDVASNAILPLVTIQLIEPATSKVVTSRLSDYEGRFTFLPEPGSYVVKASKPGFSQVTEVVQSPYPDRQPLPQTIDIKKPSERVSGDVPMKQGI